MFLYKKRMFIYYCSLKKAYIAMEKMKITLKEKETIFYYPSHCYPQNPFSLSSAFICI